MKELIIAVVIFTIFDIATYAMFKITLKEYFFEAMLYEGIVEIPTIIFSLCTMAVPDSPLSPFEIYVSISLIGHAAIAVFLFLETAKAIKARRLHKEVEEKLGSYAEEGNSIVLMDSDGRDIVVVTKYGNEREILMERPLKEYFYFIPKYKEFSVGGGVLHWCLKV